MSVISIGDTTLTILMIISLCIVNPSMEFALQPINLAMEANEREMLRLSSACPFSLLLTTFTFPFVRRVRERERELPQPYLFVNVSSPMRLQCLSNCTLNSC